MNNNNDIVIHTGKENFLEAQNKLFKLGFGFKNKGKEFQLLDDKICDECIRVDLGSKELYYGTLSLYEALKYKIYEYNNCPLFKKTLELE